MKILKFIIITFSFFININILMPPDLFSADINLIASLTGNTLMGKFNQPSAIFLDESKKRIYVADTGNNRLISFDLELNYISDFDAGGELKYPMSLVRNSHEQFYITGGAKKSELFFVDIPKKIFQILEINNSSLKENPISPGRLAIDKDDNLYLTDRGNGRILVIDKAGRYVRELSAENKLVDFSDVRIGNDGNIYSLSTLEGKIYIFNSNGKVISSFGNRGSGIQEFEFPVSIAIDQNELIYVLDKHKGSILVFKKNGEFSFSFSKKGWASGELYEPSYIYIDSWNRIYIADRGNNRIQIFQGEKR